MFEITENSELFHPQYLKRSKSERLLGISIFSNIYSSLRVRGNLTSRDYKGVPLRKGIVFIFLFLLPFLAKTQIKNLPPITTEDGLSQGMIYDVLKDKEGFLWFGTKNGLNRYDGYNFKVFTNNPFDTLSISGDEVVDLFEDSKGHFWVGTASKGLNLFDKEANVFYPVKSSEKAINEQLKNALIQKITEHPNGSIWVCAHLNTYEIKAVNFSENGSPTFEIEADKNTFETENSTIKISADEIVWLVGRDKTYYWEERQKKWVLPEIINTKQAFLPQKEQLSFSRNDHFFVSDGKQLVQYYLPEFIPKFDDTFGERTFRYRYIPTLDKYIFYASFRPQIYLYNPNASTKEEQFQLFLILKENEYPTTIFLENETTLWIGTNGYGLRKISIEDRRFQHLAKEKSINCLSILPEKGVFAHTNLNLVQSDFDKDEFSIISEQNEFLQQTRTLLPTQNGNYWAIVRAFRIDELNGLLLLDENLEQKAWFYTQEIQARYGLMQEDAAGNIWMPGRNHDFLIFHSKDRRFSNLDLTDVADIAKPHNFTQCLYKDSQGIFWKGVKNGLVKMVLDNSGQIQAVTFYQSNPQDLASLNNNSVSSCLDDPAEPDSYLWVGTKGGGLNKLNKKTGNFEHFTTKDGLADNVVYGILADDNNKLWLSTNRGLSQFNPVEKTFENYRAADGLQDDEFNTSSYAKNSATGQLYFGGINGLTVFHPKNLLPDTTQVPVYLTNLKIHNEPVAVGKELKERGENPLKKSLIATKEIELDYHQNQLSFEFASLDYDIPEKNNYEYQLHPVDLGWVRADKNRLANYANLSPGDYTFKVKGTNSSGFWNETPATLDITIHPPWWATWWAYLFYFVATLVAVYQISQFQVRREKLKNELLFEQKEAERLTDLDRIKTNFFSNITHEFRTPLTLILEPLRQLMQEEVSLPIKSKLTLAKNNSERLLKLVNQLLDVSKLEAQKMAVNYQKGNFLETIDPIFESFLPLAEKKKIELKLFTPKQLDNFYFDKNHIEKIITNLLSNAIKFTENGTVFLKVTKEINLLEDENKETPKNLIISVIDKGIGISEKEIPYVFDRFYQAGDGVAKTKKGTGIGLALTKELTELMEGEISVKSTVGKGTTFMVKLPMRVESEELGVRSDESANHIESSVLISQSLNSESKQIPEINQKIPAPHSSLITQNSSLKKVLLIEDNDELLRHFIKQSINENYEIIEAADGAEGIEKAQEIIPDLIISDLMMPKKNGFEVVKDLKNDVRTSHVPIILLTAKSAMESKLEGLRGGADEYLTKPFNTEELLVRMTNLMEIREVLKAKFQNPDGLQKMLKKREGMEPIEVDFVNKLNAFIEENLSNTGFSVELLAAHAGMSRSQLFRKLKGILSQTPNEYIRNYRLDFAKGLLQAGGKKVGEVATEVGFSDEKYFSKRFKMRFGKLPSEI